MTISEFTPTQPVEIADIQERTGVGGHIGHLALVPAIVESADNKPLEALLEVFDLHAVRDRLEAIARSHSNRVNEALASAEATRRSQVSEVAAMANLGPDFGHADDVAQIVKELPSVMDQIARDKKAGLSLPGYPIRLGPKPIDGEPPDFNRYIATVGAAVAAARLEPATEESRLEQTYAVQIPFGDERGYPDLIFDRNDSPQELKERIKSWPYPKPLPWEIYNQH